MNCFAKFLANRAISIGHAFAGLRYALKTQANVRVHLAATILVVGLGFGMGISALEWAAILAALALVWMAELLNTAIEILCDMVSLEKLDSIKRAKDTAAAAVLVSALAAAGIGAAVFIPHFV